MSTVSTQAGPSFDASTDPDLRHLLPLHSENAWSDLLATLIQTDPAIWTDLVEIDLGPVVVQREFKLSGEAGRIDLLVTSGEQVVAAEVKVLSGLGRRQLERYRDALPEAAAHLVVHPETLAIDGASDA